MSNRHWGNGFSIGLTVGISFTVFISLLLDTYPGKVAAPYSEGQEGSEIAPKNDRWWLVSRVVYMDDTLAQWLMTLITLAAVVLVYLTLRDTRIMSAETTRIGEDQSRAYITFANVGLSANFSDGKETREVKFQMLWDIDGQSPALRVATGVTSFPDAKSASIDFLRSLPIHHKKRDYGTAKSRKIGWVNVDLDDLEEVYRSGKVLWILARLEYEDVFGSKFFYSEKINLAPTSNDCLVSILNGKPVGFVINSEGVWGKIEDGNQSA